MITIKRYIRDCKKTLEPYIERHLTELTAKRAGSDGRLAGLYGTLMEAGKGGKCIRGSLVKLGYEISTGRPAGEEILPACAAFEVLQTAILGHDDVIDKSPLRRGRDSIWRAAARQAEGGGVQDGDALHYGVSQAICLGDVGILLANRFIIESSFDAERKINALKTFLDVQLNTVDGEMLDVLISREKGYGDLEGIMKISTLKTAWYTIAGPLCLGAVLGGAEAGLIDAMRRYGLLLGVAFQIRDDILGIKASEADTGKSNTSDIAEGKVTLPAHHAMKHASPEQIRQLRRIYGSAAYGSSAYDSAAVVSEADRRAVIDIFESTGAFAEASRKADAYLTEASGVIAEIAKAPEHAVLLTQLADLMARRES